MHRRDPGTACAAVLVLAFSAATAGGCAVGRPIETARELPLALDSPAVESVASPADVVRVEPPPVERAVPVEAVETTEHVVQSGETLWRIARLYGVDPDELARRNDLADRDRIAVGQRLVVPGGYVPQIDDAVDGSEQRTASPPLADGFIWPVAARRILSPFGAPRGGRQHRGVDLAGSHGEPVVAVGSGRVVYCGSALGGYGKTVILEHEGGVRSLYAHNASLHVKPGQEVARGDLIARVGRTGNASTEHLHFEIRRDGVAVDPLTMLAPHGGVRD